MDKNTLICDSIPFVYYIINKYYPTFIHDEDVIQAGMLGLCIAADKYDARKSKFSTFAGKVIKNNIASELKRRLKESDHVSLEKLMEGGEAWLL